VTYRWLAVAFAGAALLVGACSGDGDDEPTTTATADSGLTPQATSTKVDRIVATPTAVADDSPALLVIVPDQEPFTPTVAEFRQLPTSSAGGATGVSIRTIAEAAGAGEDLFVNIDGIAPGETRGFTVRYPFAEIADNTVLVLDDAGHLSLASDKLPDVELLTAVSSIAFAK
jgi:hypothetical protein